MKKPMTKRNKLIVLAIDPKRDGGSEVLIWDDRNARITLSPAKMRDLMDQCADDERRLDFILEAWLDLAEHKAKGKIDQAFRRGSQLHRYRVIVVIVDPDDARRVDVRTDGDGNMHVSIGHVFMEEIEEAAEAAGKPLVEEVINLATAVQRIKREQTLKPPPVHPDEISDYPGEIRLTDEDKANCAAVAEWRSAGGDDLDALGRKLRSARPRLIARHIHVDAARGVVKTAPLFIAKTPITWDEVGREGYDRIRGSYYRVVRMGGEWFYVSTMQIPRDAVERGWGKAGVAHCRNSRAIIQIVTPLPPPKEIQQ